VFTPRGIAVAVFSKYLDRLGLIQDETAPAATHESSGGGKKMVTLRLSRGGCKKRPIYHLMAKDSRTSRDGRFLEKLGYFVPQRGILVLNHERIEHWLSLGATQSDTARDLIKKSRRAKAANAAA
jgi:small subunit ribosomal protein S16